MTKDLFDDHYTSQKIEPIDVQEQIMRELKNVPPDVRHLLGHVIRYVMRAGNKNGDPYKKDLTKAYNYLHRAINGCWVDEGDESSKQLLVEQLSELRETPGLSATEILDRVTRGVPKNLKPSEDKVTPKSPDEFGVHL